MSAFLRRLGELTFFSLAALYATGQSIPFNPSQQNSDKAAIRFQRLPLAFEPNVGQASADTDYLVRTRNMQAELSARGMRLSLTSAGGQGKQVSIYLDGARKDGTPNPANRLKGESNYLLGTNTSNWQEHIAQYERVTYPEVYSGIDLAYYGNGSEMEHDFIVHPGATPSSIRLQFGGARKVEVTHLGDLHIALDKSEITLRRPRAYQMIDGIRHEVSAQFVLTRGVLSFHLGRYDPTQELVIDPVLDYSTFLGDASISTTGVAVDAAGDTYITGEAPVSFSAATKPATCSNCVTGTNKLAVFVTKVNPAGTAIIYSTFIGGSVDPYNDPRIRALINRLP